MSAVLMEELVEAPALTRPRWRHVPQVRGPIARPNHPGVPGGRPAVAGAPLVRARTPRVAPEPIAIAVGQGLQLTRRGLAVAVTLFLGVVTAAALTLVVGFLSIPNAPAVPQTPSVGVHAG